MVVGKPQGRVFVFFAAFQKLIQLPLCSKSLVYSVNSAICEYCILEFPMADRPDLNQEGEARTQEIDALRAIFDNELIENEESNFEVREQVFQESIKLTNPFSISD